MWTFLEVPISVRRFHRILHAPVLTHALVERVWRKISVLFVVSSESE